MAWWKEDLVCGQCLVLKLVNWPCQMCGSERQGLESRMLSKQHVIPTCPYKTHEHKRRPEARLNRELTQTNDSMKKTVTWWLWFNGFVKWFSPWISMKCACLLSNITSHSFCGFFITLVNLLSQDNGIKTFALDNTLSFCQYNTQNQRSLC